MVSICLNPQEVFLFPSGFIPPLFMDISGSGIIFFGLTTCSIPNPLHRAHIPLGELNEKEFGSGFG